jgi:hypothetical protein
MFFLTTNNITTNGVIIVAYNGQFSCLFSFHFIVKFNFIFSSNFVHIYTLYNIDKYFFKKYI